MVATLLVAILTFWLVPASSYRCWQVSILFWHWEWWVKKPCDKCCQKCAPTKTHRLLPPPMTSMTLLLACQSHNTTTSTPYWFRQWIDICDCLSAGKMAELDYYFINGWGWVNKSVDSTACCLIPTSPYSMPLPFTGTIAAKLLHTAPCFRHGPTSLCLWIVMFLPCINMQIVICKYFVL